MKMIIAIAAVFVIGITTAEANCRYGSGTYSDGAIGPSDQVCVCPADTSGDAGGGCFWK